MSAPFVCAEPLGWSPTVDPSYSPCLPTAAPKPFAAIPLLSSSSFHSTKPMRSSPSAFPAATSRPAARTPAKKAAAAPKVRAAQSTDKKTRHADPERVKRPPNPFILFRAHFAAAHRGDKSPDSLSRRASTAWHDRTRAEGEHWTKQAEIALAEHRRRYPDYVFRPRRQQKLSSAPAKHSATRSMSAASRPCTSSTTVSDRSATPPFQQYSRRFAYGSDSDGRSPSPASTAPPGTPPDAFAPASPEFCTPSGWTAEHDRAPSPYLLMPTSAAPRRSRATHCAPRAFAAPMGWQPSPGAAPVGLLPMAQVGGLLFDGCTFDGSPVALAPAMSLPWGVDSFGIDPLATSLVGAGQDGASTSASPSPLQTPFAIIASSLAGALVPVPSFASPPMATGAPSPALSQGPFSSPTDTMDVDAAPDWPGCSPRHTTYGFGVDLGAELNLDVDYHLGLGLDLGAFAAHGAQAAPGLQAYGRALEELDLAGLQAGSGVFFGDVSAYEDILVFDETFRGVPSM